jgi:glycosyltransferase involved in cell wall biosynthesis
MIIVNLVASPFVGGPEQQMLGLASSLPDDCRTVFVAFANSGKSAALVNEARRQGFEAIVLKHDAPEFGAAAREVAKHLRRLRADVLCCHGYKPDIIGWRAARQAGVPVVAVAHGWTGATFKVRLNERLDRVILRWMDRVVCVSEAEAVKVRAAGVPSSRVLVIRNAIGRKAFAAPDPEYGERLRSLLPEDCDRIVGAAGRLSPEKGFDQLVEAAVPVLRAVPTAGFVLFGEGPLRSRLAEQISARGLEGRFVLAGFRTDLGRFLPHLDLAVLSSYTEGLPVFILEACAAGVPVIASAVGGVPEVVEDGVNGYLVPPGRPDLLAQGIVAALSDEDRRRAMGENGRKRVRENFTLGAQSAQYLQLFESLALRQTPLRSVEERWERALLTAQG